MTDEQQPPESSEPEPIAWSEFLESYPLNTGHLVSGYDGKIIPSISSSAFERLAPTLRLYCYFCGGIRNFAGEWEGTQKFIPNTATNDFLQYTCKDCEKQSKTFCIRSSPTSEMGVGFAIKIGECPESHVELPRSLKSLLDDDYELFIKGLACEKRGLGVGAFTYYRRVVESHKNHLISEILRVAQKLGAPEQIRETLAQAAREKQFSRAVETIKDAIPQALLVDSQNPLKLLHDALSIGVHAESDADCLRIAHGVRMVLTDLSERLKLALQYQAELRAAIGELSRFIGAGKRKPGTGESSS